MRTVFESDGTDCGAYADEADLRSYIARSGVGIVHAHPLDNLPLSARAARECGVPLVTTCHSLPWALWPLRAVTPQPDHFFCVCDAVKAALDRAGVDPGRSSVVYNGVDLERFRPPAVARTRVGPPRVIYFGRFDFKEEALRAVEAACHQLGWSLRVLGGKSADYPDPASPDLSRRAASSRGLGGRQAPLSPDEVPHALADADFVFAAGRSAIEAMALGKVVLVINASSVPPVLSGYEGVVTPYNAYYLLETNFSAWGERHLPIDVDRIVNDLTHALPYRRFLGEFGRLFTRVHLSAKRAARGYLRVYQALSC
jgi:glycosyltransferase involved in cell wall biosynthesis